MTVEALHRTVRRHWVEQFLCQHRTVDGEERWGLFEASGFYSFVPQLEWPHAPWTAMLVEASLRAMHDRSAPGFPDIPIAEWKVLPEAWHGADELD